jgi:DNA-binding Lrp family transcriptional regulator
MATKIKHRRARPAALRRPLGGDQGRVHSLQGMPAMTGKESDNLDPTDKAILRLVQSGLPIDERPFLKLGQKLGLDESEIISRLAALKEKGVIRRIGGNFDSASLGWAATLCAAKAPADKFDRFVAAVNAFPGVTHNYRRDHEYNVWFTFIAPDMERIEANLAQLSQDTGVTDICSMPSIQKYKIKVDFPV